MKHPTPEVWMSFLYDELDAGERAGLNDHLSSCSECAAKMRDWQAARTNLDWPLPMSASRRSAGRAPASFGRVLKWAVAALILAGIGFGAGRLTSPAADIGKIRAALEPEIQNQVRSARSELRGEFAQLLRVELEKNASATVDAACDQTEGMLANWIGSLEARRAEDNRALYAALNDLQSQRDADYLLLKKDVDTVAVNADAGLRKTERQLIQLAGYTEPNNVSP